MNAPMSMIPEGFNRSLRNPVILLRVAFLCLLTLPSPALSHEQAGIAVGFLMGLGHPVSGLDHVIAMVAVGLWGAQLGMPAVILLPVAFPIVMAFGGMLGLIGIPLPAIELGIAASAVALGALVLTSAKPPLWMALAVVGFFAIFHGYAHGTELPPGESGLLYSIGFVVATGLLHAFGISIGFVHRWPVGRVMLRVAGGVVMFGGVYFLAGAIG